MTVIAPPAAWAFDAIGTRWSIETPEPIPQSVRAAVDDTIERFDRAWSRFRSDSLVSRMARRPGRWRLPAEAARLLELYRALHDATGGRMSPLVGRSLEALGYDDALRMSPGRPVSAPPWRDALSWDGTELELPRPALLDVGAAGKGLLVDLVGEELARHGHPDSVVDGSGDVRVRGAGAGRLERVALEHPADPTKAVGVVELSAGALAASAGNRRAWAGMHHILDATTGLPVREIVASWAIADDAMTADGAATALFLASGTAVEAALPGIHWLRMRADGRLERSAGFPGEVFA